MDGDGQRHSLLSSHFEALADSVLDVLQGFALGHASGEAHMLWSGTTEQGGRQRMWNDLDGVDAPSRYAFLANIIPEYFIIDDALKASRNWVYCRPTEEERVSLLAQMQHPHSKRSYWWLRKK